MNDTDTIYCYTCRQVTTWYMNIYGDWRCRRCSPPESYPPNRELEEEARLYKKWHHNHDRRHHGPNEESYR